MTDIKSTDTPALKISHLTKLYDDDHGIKDISLTVNQGEVFGFLGPNGAGKSTTINTILDALRPDSGSIEILGLNHQKRVRRVHKHIGYLSGDMETDPTLTGRQYLSFVSHLYGNVEQKTITGLAKRLKADLSVKIKHLSRGNRQKIGLIAALMHDPDVLILDEPTSGLDPLIQTEFNAIIKEHKERGKTTFMSSHVLSEVQETCDRVGFIREGKLVHVGSLRTLLEKTPRRVEVRLRNELSGKQLKQLDGVRSLKHTDGLTSFTFAGDINRLLRIFAAHPVDSLTISEPDLEELFMGYYRGENKHV
ncbi:MAG: ABC transporter ATP-binding protein [Candidatus Nomurabacteria bacterium]|nr:MAG: ABC transporter ATP-binding protein [Candidatus Nomurabacteria bacterium]